MADPLADSDKCIEAFEAWAKEAGFPTTKTSAGRYIGYSTRVAWRAWQACERSKAGE